MVLKLIFVVVVKNEGPYDEDEENKKGKRKRQKDENVVYACNLCDSQYRNKGALRFHLMQHNPKSKNKFQCIG